MSRNQPSPPPHCPPSYMNSDHLVFDDQDFVEEERPEWDIPPAEWPDVPNTWTSDHEGHRYPYGAARPVNRLEPPAYNHAAEYRQPGGDANINLSENTAGRQTNEEFVHGNTTWRPIGYTFFPPPMDSNQGSSLVTNMPFIPIIQSGEAGASSGNPASTQDTTQNDNNKRRDMFLRPLQARARWQEQERTLTLKHQRNAATATTNTEMTESSDASETEIRRELVSLKDRVNELIEDLRQAKLTSHIFEDVHVQLHGVWRDSLIDLQASNRQQLDVKKALQALQVQGLMNELKIRMLEKIVLGEKDDDEFRVHETEQENMPGRASSQQTASVDPTTRASQQDFSSRNGYVPGFGVSKDPDAFNSAHATTATTRSPANTPTTTHYGTVPDYPLLSNPLNPATHTASSSLAVPSSASSNPPNPPWKTSQQNHDTSSLSNLKRSAGYGYDQPTHILPPSLTKSDLAHRAKPTVAQSQNTKPSTTLGNQTHHHTYLNYRSNDTLLLNLGSTDTQTQHQNPRPARTPCERTGGCNSSSWLRGERED